MQKTDLFSTSPISISSSAMSRCPTAPPSRTSRPSKSCFASWAASTCGCTSSSTSTRNTRRKWWEESRTCKNWKGRCRSSLEGSCSWPARRRRSRPERTFTLLSDTPSQNTSPSASTSNSKSALIQEETQGCGRAVEEKEEVKQGQEARGAVAEAEAEVEEKEGEEDQQDHERAQVRRQEGPIQKGHRRALIFHTATPTIYCLCRIVI